MTIREISLVVAAALVAFEEPTARLSERPMGQNCTAASPCAAADVRQHFLPDGPERSMAATSVPLAEYGNFDAGRFFGFEEAGDRVGFGQGPFSDFSRKSVGV
ncbi:MAG: hypothetical protein ACREE2_19715 [Stellaceae bacterium]